MITILVGAALAMLATMPALARSYDDIMREAQAAFTTEDYGPAAALLDEAQRLRPYSLYLTRNRVLTRLLTNRDAEALAIAQEIADRGLVLEMPAHEAFDAMRAMPAFAPIARQFAANASPKGAAVIVAEFVEAGLLPEAIASRKGRMLIGSVRTGALLDATADLDPLATLDGGVFDIEMTRKSVFAAVNNQLAFEKRTAAPFAALVELDPKSGGERRRIRVGGGDALIGDIEIDREGVIYASDSLIPRLFITNRGDTEARVFVTDERWANPQGIALDRKRGCLFLADYLTGLFVVDVETGEVTPIANPSGAHLGGIDGLYLFEGGLIGIQNGTVPQRIVRIGLDSTGTSAERLDVLAQNLDGWNEPTHGVVVGDEFRYIATSNWPAYDDAGDPRKDARLVPLRIMSIPLARD